MNLPLPLKLLVGSFAAFSIALAGCAADTSNDTANDDAEDTNVSQDELSALATKFVGEYAWNATDSGAFVDFEQVKLSADGTYTAKVDSSLVDSNVVCVRYPCTLPESGTWQAYKSAGKTKLRFRPTGHASRSYYASLANDVLSLTRLGQTTKLFKKSAGPTCATVRCMAGYHCEMKGINGGAVPACIKDAPLAACKRTGCSGQICADRDMFTTCEWRPEYACYQQATCERQADGSCGFTQTPALQACLGGI
jgi:hypothetical protein